MLLGPGLSRMAVARGSRWIGGLRWRLCPANRCGCGSPSADASVERRLVAVLLLFALISVTWSQRCEDAARLTVLAVQSSLCSPSQSSRSVRTQCNGSNSTRGYRVGAYLRPVGGSGAPTPADTSFVSMTSSGCFSPPPAGNASAAPEVVARQVLLVPCVPPNGVRVCFAVSCCDASPATGNTTATAELCVTVAARPPSISANASQQRAVSSGDGSASLLVNVSVGEKPVVAMTPPPSEQCGCLAPSCLRLSYLPGCSGPAACANLTATAGTDSSPTSGPTSSGDGGLGTNAVVALVVSLGAVLGTALSCYCLVRAGRFRHDDGDIAGRRSRPYSSSSGKPVLADDADQSIVSANGAFHGEIRTLQDLTFGRMSPEMAASRHHSSYVPAPVAVAAAAAAAADEEADVGGAPLPPLKYSEIIESGSFANWMDCGVGDAAEGSRMSVASLASRLREDGGGGSCGRITLHANSVALGLNELDDATPAAAAENDVEEHPGTSV